MKRRCTWVMCSEAASNRVGYWGEWHHLCDEHADLIGDDGSMIDPNLEGVS